MFYMIGLERFHTVLKEEGGEWIISYDQPSAPLWVSEELLQMYQNITVPEKYLINRRKEISEAEKRRMEMIQPLIADEQCIKCKKRRRMEARKISQNHQTTEKRILRLYYQYLATGTLLKVKEPRKRDDSQKEQYKNFEWAIRTFYYSAKRISLQTAYDMMLLARYTDEHGHLMSEIPSWHSFRHFYYENSFHRKSKKEISRNGLSAYQRNNRPVFGSAMNWKDKIGYYQMDATVADIYLVSRFSRKVVIGRPNIYLAVDTVSQLIAGIYVGLESDQRAVMLCLANAARDKVEFCKQYGIDIKKEQWPSRNLPGGIITDQGSEFIFGVSEELCDIYGIEIEILPPYRPDEKSLVEKTFDIIQTKYKPNLRGKGVIEKDAAERWATDYRNQAVLNLDEFTRIIIEIVLYINSERILDSYIPSFDMIEFGISPVPCNIWDWYNKCKLSAHIPINERNIYYMSLERKQTSISRKGILFNGILYKNENISKIMEDIKNHKNITIAFDSDNIKSIYLVKSGTYIEFSISDDYLQLSNLNADEYKLYKKSLNEIKHSSVEQTKSRVKLIKSINEVISHAAYEEKGNLDGKEIGENRKRERNKRS
ncbi:integrase catalytic domain-containing protein [Hungatella hathewayi]|uniref:integrase catalytic domain-containing protein n=1 Tax=Hungatella hathewayi TaxID=154046 RepID=UPI0035654DCC